MVIYFKHRCNKNYVLITKYSIPSDAKKMITKTIEYPYHNEEIIYPSSTGDITLAGTLSMPTNPPRAIVLLIAGMGPADRDAKTPSGHKPFLALADHLARHGIAVLRYDKRGVGASTGTFSFDITSADLADDARAGITYLMNRPEFTGLPLGLAGHSEGGMIAAMVAANSSNVAFVVSLAGVAATDVETIVDQTANQLRADGASEALVQQNSVIRRQLLTIALSDETISRAAGEMVVAVEKYWSHLPEALQEESANYLFALTKENAAKGIFMMNSPWYRFFLHHKPANDLEKITVPYLGLYGEIDHIVTASRAISCLQAAFKKAGNPHVTMAVLPKHNHQLQEAETGALQEYASIKEAISSTALEIITTWVLKQC